MIRVYLSPLDERDLADCVASLPKSIETLRQEVELVHDQRITPGYVLATIDGSGILGP